MIPPGPLSAATAAELDAAVRLVRALGKMRAAAPLSVVRGSDGQPNLYLNTNALGGGGDGIFTLCLPTAGGKMVVPNGDGTYSCEDIPVCDGGCPPLWYCVDGVATSVAVEDAPPSGTSVSGPYRTQAAALVACPVPTVDLLCAGCGTTYKVRKTFYAVVTNATKFSGDANLAVTNGTWTLTSTGGAWSGSRTYMVGTQSVTTTVTVSAQCVDGGTLRLSGTMSMNYNPGTVSGTNWCGTAVGAWLVTQSCGGGEGGVLDFGHDYTCAAGPDWTTPSAVLHGTRTISTGFEGGGVTLFDLTVSY